MPTDPGDKAEELEPVFTALPIQCYKVDAKAYVWPKKNRCIFCLVGKFKLVPPNTLLCNTCKAEFHIPYTA